QWDNLDKWPFGVHPQRALELGDVDSVLPEDEREASLREHFQWFGWDMMSEFAHFTAPRLSVTSSEYALIAVAHAAMSLSVATSMLRRQCAWAASLGAVGLVDILGHCQALLDDSPADQGV
ncbi:MAG: hypothetical protein R6X13_05650, partial [bacterium]